MVTMIHHPDIASHNTPVAAAIQSTHLAPALRSMIHGDVIVIVGRLSKLVATGLSNTLDSGYMLCLCITFVMTKHIAMHSRYLDIYQVSQSVSYDNV